MRFLILGLTPFDLSTAIFLSLATTTGCSSGPSVPDATHPPAWVTQPTRTVDGGYIVYVGSGEDENLQRAHFKAEAMALQDLANECSLTPKGARVEDHYDQDVGVLHHSYAKVAVEYPLCESARNAVTPEEIRKLASEPMTAQVKQYQELYDEPEEEEEMPPAPAVASNAGTSSPSSNGGSGGTNPRIFIASAPEYYVMSQQIAYVKQTVILAPPAQYPPQAQITTQPVAAIVPAQSAVNQYAATNPTMRAASAPAYSTVRPNAEAHQAAALHQSTSARQSGQPRNASGGAAPAKGSGKRKRRNWHR